MKRCRLTPFSAALDLQMAKRDLDSRSLLIRMSGACNKDDHRLLEFWCAGRTRPRYDRSLLLLGKIERYFGLQNGYFLKAAALLDKPSIRVVGAANPSQQTAFKWHLPHDFDTRSAEERDEIVAWINANVMPCTTDFGKYQSQAVHRVFSVVFPGLGDLIPVRKPSGRIEFNRSTPGRAGAYGTVQAPAALEKEMRSLVLFKASPLAPRTYVRAPFGWQKNTALQFVRRFGEVFGLLAAAPLSATNGLGLPLAKLTFGLFVFPAVWDWYFEWRFRTRGFFNCSERSLTYALRSMVRDPTGWLRQHSELRKRLHPIPGLVSAKDVETATKDWASQCGITYRYAEQRVADFTRSMRPHRDPFLPILPVLQSERPLNEYRKIGDEILRLMPDADEQPERAAAACRSYLMVRFALHLGLRQRNLRELLLCKPGSRPRSVQQLESLKRGEIRWHDEGAGWLVYLPAAAFKNAASSFFQGRPYQLQLPNLEKLNFWIKQYVEVHRPILLAGEKDPGTFFVGTAHRKGAKPEYDVFGYYSAWKTIIQFYGIYNPFTERGAIKGLLPHGPHSVRDVLATHVLKQTGSFELASFAIQDTVEAVKRHYGRFLPDEKAARAAAILDAVWQKGQI